MNIILSIRCRGEQLRSRCLEVKHCCYFQFAPFFLRSHNVDYACCGSYLQQGRPDVAVNSPFHCKESSLLLMDLEATGGSTILMATRQERQRSRTTKAVHFELLAAVAGKLLQESDCSSASSNAAMVVDNYNLNEEPHRNLNEAISDVQECQGSFEESGISSSVLLRKCAQKVSNKEAALGA